MKYLTILLLFITSNSTAQHDESRDSCLIIPKSISQRNNEELLIRSNCNLATFSFKLFNRWGELLYETSNFSSPLDFNISEMTGTKKNPVLKYQSGVYFWIIEFRLLNEHDPEKIENMTGYINII